ncbi:carbohydrate ABC transporter permease [Alicyclobacillus fastidiosus]|uniref:Sugar ABC transporter permease n=1 Tax=Alicyclobacillus fastidiosus TaxID=392011 RepID=A0ABV5ACW9_9BACL|nr:sugar ABC transporter permease [Alicyclobacillus fastidiosus]WEH10539.1 sugar ABC transporter permease [Alicyclobacillus fastidiosus]
MRKRRWPIIVGFLTPALVLYLMFIVYPFLSSIRYSLYNWNGVGPLVDFIGLKNFTYVLFSHEFAPQFWRAVAHNLYFFVLSMILTSIFGLLLAYLLVAVKERASRWFQVIYFIPMVVPPVVVAYIWSMYLEPNYGAISRALTSLHLNVLNVPFLGSGALALPTIAVITAWAGMGFPILIFIAAMINIPEEMIEAAKVDGASRTKIFFSVIFPFIKPTFLTITTLNFVGAFGAFDYIYIMEGTQAGPNYATDVIGTLFYRTAFGGFGTTAQGVGLATALAFVGFIIVMIASAFLVLLQRRASMDL